MILFRNPGLINMTAATTIGVNVKEGESPIGQFGTGLKAAIAIVLRLGGTVEIYRGSRPYTFARRTSVIRGKKHNLITMNGQRLGYTDHYAEHWQAWMAYRELWSNCKDENGSVERVGSLDDVKLKPGTTTIVVNCKEIENAHDERHTIVLQSEPMVRLPGVDVHAGVSEFVYYRGIRVADVPNKKKSIYHYCLTGHQYLTEDRTLAYQWNVPDKIAQALVQCTNPMIVASVLSAPGDSFEASLPWGKAKDVTPSPQFMEVAENLRNNNKLTGSALDLFKKYMDSTVGYASPYLVELTVFQKQVLRNAIGKLDRTLGVKLDEGRMVFKSERASRGICTEGDHCVIPVEFVNNSVLELARDLLVWWVGEEFAGSAGTLAHRLIVGDWPQRKKRLVSEARPVPEEEDIF